MRALGFEIVATRGTAAALGRARIPATLINKVGEGSPHVVDALRSGAISMVVNTTIGAKEVKDSYSLRRQTLLLNIPYFTTMAAGLAACDALEAARGHATPSVRSLQEWAAD
jgi:carbamoyl-phosphate synthase large subunit